ncbi:hypothetical protein [Deinococcus frigens]|uniref:hypothetical protein n=1 Tax=Deinococcus frigens TaxID=249403 RepID=UPI0012EBB6BD|nr:hypothetical protein [Deinococcus frigens]
MSRNNSKAFVINNCLNTSIIGCRATGFNTGFEFINCRHTRVDKTESIGTRNPRNLDQATDYISKILESDMESEKLSKGFVVKDSFDTTLKNTTSIGHDIGYEIDNSDSTLLDGAVTVSREVYKSIHEIDFIISFVRGSRDVEVKLFQQTLESAKAELMSPTPHKGMLLAFFGYISGIVSSAASDAISSKLNELSPEILERLHELYHAVKIVVSQF